MLCVSVYMIRCVFWYREQETFRNKKNIKIVVVVVSENTPREGGKEVV